MSGRANGRTGEVVLVGPDDRECTRLEAALRAEGYRVRIEHGDVTEVLLRCGRGAMVVVAVGRGPRPGGLAAQ